MQLNILGVETNITQSYESLHYCINIEKAAEVPTRAFDLTDIVARKPPSPAIKHPLPPAAILLASHADDITLAKGELILVGLLEVETCPHKQLLSTVF